MIFLGDPESKGEKEDAKRCVTMAIEMRKRLKSLREEWTRQGITSLLHVRMGINTGFCTVGNFGSEERLDYTIIGGQVNLASRLESCAGPDQILISRDTFLLINETISCREMGEIQVKGIAKPVMTYQVIDYHENVSSLKEVIKEEDRGISIEVDMNKIDSGRAIDILKNAISKIEKS
jgi:adenylate cyclase